MFKFVWDDQKAASNLRKHGISFDEAVSVFADDLALTFADTDHFESEDRSRTYGISNKGRLLVVVHTERRYNVRIISARKATRYVAKSDQDIPELRRAQLGVGVRGKYFRHFTQGSNVVVLQPEIQKAFPTSEAVNKALASMLAFAQEAQGLVGAKRTPRKRSAG
ncbi:MAG: BrnT family toxin [Betaproteobacteria bacterium]|nr:BrnT family toxin [Betaproteobacteria bacterium]